MESTKTPALWQISGQTGLIEIRTANGPQAIPVPAAPPTAPRSKTTGRPPPGGNMRFKHQRLPYVIPENAGGVYPALTVRAWCRAPSLCHNSLAVTHPASGYKVGDFRASVRKALFMAALAARQYNPALKAFYERLIQNGKKPMVAITAIMRKMIVILNAKMRDAFYRPDEITW